MAHIIPFIPDAIIKDAVTFSSILSLLSLGLTLTYMTTRVPNFAHGSLAAIGTYVSFTAARVLNQSPYSYVPVAFLMGAFVALALYKLVLKPLSERGATVILLMIATIAFDIILLAILNIYADYVTFTFKVQSRYFSLRGRDFWVGDTPGVLIVAPLTALTIVVTLHLLLTKTKFGVAMRATIENPSLAGVVGINTELVRTISWILAGGLAGIAGSMMSLWFPGNPDLGSRIIVSVFTASILGGFFNIYGAVLGAFLVGFAEFLGIFYLSLAPPPLGAWVLPYRPLIPLLIMALTLIFIPKGLTSIRWRQLLRTIQVRLWYSLLKQ